MNLHTIGPYLMFIWKMVFNKTCILLQQQCIAILITVLQTERAPQMRPNSKLSGVITHTRYMGMDKWLMLHFRILLCTIPTYMSTPVFSDSKAPCEECSPYYRLLSMAKADGNAYQHYSYFCTPKIVSVKLLKYSKCR